MQAEEKVVWFARKKKGKYSNERGWEKNKIPNQVSLHTPKIINTTRN